MAGTRKFFCHLFLAVFLESLALSAFAKLQCLSADGKAVDWYFICSSFLFVFSCEFVIYDLLCWLSWPAVYELYTLYEYPHIACMFN